MRLLLCLKIYIKMQPSKNYKKVNPQEIKGPIYPCHIRATITQFKEQTTTLFFYEEDNAAI